MKYYKNDLHPIYRKVNMTKWTNDEMNRLLWIDMTYDENRTIIRNIKKMTWNKKIYREMINVNDDNMMMKWHWIMTLWQWKIDDNGPDMMT